MRVILALRLAGWLVLIGLVAAGAFFLLARQPEIEPVAATPPGDAELIAAGERIALLGNCAGCDTAPAGAPLAGGLPISTPFGTIHATNITPDPETGIGRWSEEAYMRSMREGIDREGRRDLRAAQLPRPGAALCAFRPVAVDAPVAPELAGRGRGGEIGPALR